MTVAQIAKRRCLRCRKRGHATWSICADGNRPRVICRACDVALNRMVLRWAGDGQWRQKMARYEATA